MLKTLKHHKWTKLEDNKLKDKVFSVSDFKYVTPKENEGQTEFKRLGYNPDIQKALWEHFQDEKVNGADYHEAGKLNKAEVNNLLNAFKTISNRFGAQEWNNPNIGVILSKKRAKNYLINKGHIDVDIDLYLKNNYPYNSIVMRHNDTGFVFARTRKKGLFKYLKQEGFIFNTELVGVKKKYKPDEVVTVREGYYDQAILSNQGMNEVAIGTKYFSEDQWKHLADAGVTKVILNLDSEYNHKNEHKHTPTIIAIIRFLQQYGISVDILELDKKDSMDYWDKNDPEGSIQKIKNKSKNKIPSYEWMAKVDWNNPNYKNAGHFYLPID